MDNNPGLYILYFLLAIGLIAVSIAITRAVFRINRQVRNQNAIIFLLSIIASKEEVPSENISKGLMHIFKNEETHFDLLMKDFKKDGFVLEK